MGDCATKPFRSHGRHAHVKHAMAQTVRIVPQAGQGLAGGLTCVFTHFTNRGYQRVICVQQRQPAPPSINTVVCV